MCFSQIRKTKMTNESQTPQNELPDSPTSPVYIDDGNLYVNATEWDRLCNEQSTGPLVSVFRDAKQILAKGRAVRLINHQGGIALSADRPGELQGLLDNANARRAAASLAPVIPEN
jgi:hypothetical protein